MTIDNKRKAVNSDNANQIEPERAKILLTEYEQVSNFIRHYNTILWAVASIFLPFSWASIYFSLNLGKDCLPLCIGSIGLSILWTLIYYRWKIYRRAGFIKLHELEDELSLSFHHSVTESEKGIEKRIVTEKNIVNLNLIIIIASWLIIWLKIIGLTKIFEFLFLFFLKLYFLISS